MWRLHEKKPQQSQNLRTQPPEKMDLYMYPYNSLYFCKLLCYQWLLTYLYAVTRILNIEISLQTPISYCRNFWILISDKKKFIHFHV